MTSSSALREEAIADSLYLTLYHKSPRDLQ